MKSFKFEVITPTKVFYEDDVEYINFTALNGEMGVLAGHAPTLVANKPCTLTIKKDGKENHAFISEGFIEITKEKVSAVVDMADWSKDINTEEEIKKLKEEEEKLEHRHHDAERSLELKASIERSKAAIKASNFR